MRAVDLIERKRDGQILGADELDEFVSAVVRGDVPDYQISAFLMAVYFRGMVPEELVPFTRAMMNSGDTLELKGLAGRYRADKHSTGGVGDKVSLSLAPMLAACGLTVPMISGRGLGHTGGTLDKLESIAGYRVDLDEGEIEAAIDKCGYVITGQTGTLVPADRIFYALRDVTGTVPSIPLIASSIMSKKMSVGLNGLILDVKVGTGAFMKTLAQARELADTMISIGRGLGCDTRACITNMNQPLGRQIGNSNELIEAIEMLKGNHSPDYATLCYALGSELVSMAKNITREEAEGELRNSITSGRALEAMRANIAAQGGDPRILDDYSLLPHVDGSPTIVKAQAGGYISGFDSSRVGRACCVLGGGRSVAGETIDHGVGITVCAKIGDEVSAGTPIFEVYGHGKKLEEAVHMLETGAFSISEEVEDIPLILDVRV